MVVWGGRRVCSQVTEASLWQGGRNVRAESGLKVEIAKGAGKGIRKSRCSGVVRSFAFWYGFFFFFFFVGLPGSQVLLLLCCVGLEAAWRAQILFPFLLCDPRPYTKGRGSPSALTVFCRC